MTLTGLLHIEMVKDWNKLYFIFFHKIIIYFFTKVAIQEYVFIASYYKQLSAEFKMKNYKIKTRFVRLICMIFQSGLEPVLIQRIVIGFEAILEKN